MGENLDWFKKGAVVEVSLEEEGFRGSWYTARVVRRRSGKLFLEFETLVVDDSSKPLRELVDLVLARPVPPREQGRRFSLGEDVDAFHNDGWWEGVVTSLSPDGALCSVFFRSSREQIPFPHSLLRLHREWVHGEWLPPMPQ